MVGRCVEVEHVSCILLVQRVLEPGRTVRRIGPRGQRACRVDFVLLVRIVLEFVDHLVE